MSRDYFDLHLRAALIRKGGRHLGVLQGLLTGVLCCVWVGLAFSGLSCAPGERLVDSAAPIAAFEASSDLVGHGSLQVAFQDKSLGDVLGRRWDFGDGSPGSTLDNPVHDFQVAGQYDVKLVVWNDAGSDSIVEARLVTVVPSYLPFDGLLAYYPFAGGALDRSGHGYDGVLNGAIDAANVLVVPPETTGFLDLPSGLLRGRDVYSIAAFVKLSNVHENTLFDLHGRIGELLRLQFGTTTGGCAWIIEYYFEGGSAKEGMQNGCINDLRWAFMCFAKSGPDIWLHLNSEKKILQASLGSDYLVVGSIESITIGQGRNNDGSITQGKSWGGQIDELLVYDRVLTSSEIRLLASRTPSS